MDLEAKNDPANIAAFWNPTDLAGLEALCGAFPVGEILKGWGLDQVSRYNVTQPGYMKALDSIYTEENLELLRDWLTVRTVEQWSGYLDRATRDDVKAAKEGALGIRGAESDEKVVVKTIFEDMPIPADNLYIARYCTPEMRDEIQQIIDAVIAEYRKMLGEETWLTEDTREKALEKLDSITVRAVYPETLITWDGLDIGEGSSLLEAAIDVLAYARDQEIGTLSLPVDKSE